MRAVAKRRGREFWQRAVAMVEVEGLSHAAAAARVGTSVGTLRSWIYRLRREQRTPRPTPPVRVLPVAVTGGSTPRAARAVRLRVGAVHLRVDEGTDPAYVAALLTALRAAAC